MFKKFLLTLGLILFSGLFFFYSAAAQGTPPTPTPTIEPTVVALQQQVEALSTQVAGLSDSTVKNKQAIGDLQEKYLPISIALASLGLLGIPVVGIGLINYWKNLQKKMLDEAFYKVDPPHYPIQIPASRFDEGKKRLQNLGFRDLREYTFLDEPQTRGIVIYQITMSMGKETALADLRAFESFITSMKKAQKLNPKEVAYVVYLEGRLDEASSLPGLFENIVLANMPVALATHIYALARGLMQAK
jgi:hypothetical protein